MTPTEQGNGRSTNGMPAMSSKETRILLGIAAGVAVGIGVALSRRKKSRWDTVRAIPQRVTARSGDLADISRDLAGRVAHLYDESCKLLEDAGRLWSNGRKLVGH